MAVAEDFEMWAEEDRFGRESVGVELSACIADLRDEVACLADVELGGAVEQMSVLRRRLEAVELEVVGRFDRSMEWSVDGYRHPTTAVADRCRVPRAVAGKRVGLSRKLLHMPVVAASLAAGRIGLSHVDILARTNTPKRREVFAQAEEMLVGNAERLSFADFVRTVEYFVQQVDSCDGDDDPPGHETRSCHSSRLFDGTGKVDANLDPAGWTEFDTVLRRIEQELFDADWAALVSEHGDQVSLDQLPRTPAQRRADALVEMAPSSPPPRPPRWPSRVTCVGWCSTDRARRSSSVARSGSSPGRSVTSSKPETGAVPVLVATNRRGSATWITSSSGNRAEQPTPTTAT